MESEINQPHEHDPDPDDFFDAPAEAPTGEGSIKSEPPGEATDEPAKDTGSDAEQPGGGGDGEDAGTTAVPPGDPDNSAEERKEPEPEPEPEPAEEPEGKSEPEPAKKASSNGSGKTPTTEERTYRVFQKLPLTKEVLKSLLKELDEGNDPNVRVVYTELPSVSSRTVVNATRAAYSQNKAALGPKQDLALVTERSFIEKHIEPRTREVEALSIS